MAMTTDKHTDSGADTPESVAPLARYFLWADSASGVDRFIKYLVWLGVFLFLMDFVWHRHVKVPGEGFYGFHAIAGFLSFTVIVIGARALRLLIRRDENFYAPDGVDSEEYPEAGTERLSHADRTQESLMTLRDEMLGRKPKSESQDNGQGGASS
ncbi:hypothetical protein [Granulosicoccus antarcticus]|uniref:Uncharacterized protein n=1 Tax=Granulosicoccus antarcticus IMCC3135 TaxID=1192854 RepID=A0A2Z2NNA3_9GAMM|nr:hypothetical protein [Granulosicoccus antarcticus]ASJ72942.1 hypothetical protein IMCC3135_14285 [Granulosicoccus antarcticus IMCC3135]